MIMLVVPWILAVFTGYIAGTAKNPIHLIPVFIVIVLAMLTTNLWMNQL